MLTFVQITGEVVGGELFVHGGRHCVSSYLLICVVRVHILLYIVGKISRNSVLCKLHSVKVKQSRYRCGVAQRVPGS